MDDSPFEIEGPDGDGFVWISLPDGGRHMLGPVDQVAEALSQWLTSVDDGERL
jgi:hypothetical protein